MTIESATIVLTLDSEIVPCSDLPYQVSVSFGRRAGYSKDFLPFETRTGTQKRPAMGGPLNFDTVTHLGRTSIIIPRESSHLTKSSEPLKSSQMIEVVRIINIRRKAKSKEGPRTDVPLLQRFAPESHGIESGGQPIAGRAKSPSSPSHITGAPGPHQLT